MGTSNSMGPMGSMNISAPPGPRAAPPSPRTGTMLPPTGTMPPGSMQGFTQRIPGSALSAAPPPGYQQDYRTTPPGSMNTTQQYNAAFPGSMNIPGSFGMPMMPGSQSMPPTGSLPPGSMPLSMPIGGTTPPRTMISPQSQGMSYEAAAQFVTKRMKDSIDRHGGLIRDLDGMTNGAYSSEVKGSFSAARKAGLDDIDWRVPHLIYSKDPKFNEGLDPRFAFEVQQRKLTDGRVLEEELSSEAQANWQMSHTVPFPEAQVWNQPGVAFVEAVPNYRNEEDIWSSRLDLRTLDEAMRGDVVKPMPRPSVYAEDYENYREGRYVKDDCPIS